MHLYATVKLMPIERDNAVSLIPVLLYRTSSEEFRCSYEALEFAYICGQSHSSGKVFADIKVLSRLMMFFDVVSRGVEINELDLQHIVYQYLSVRLAGTLDAANKCTYGDLNWSPVRYQTIQQEFRTIVRFFGFCARQFGYINLSRPVLTATAKNPFKKMYEAMEMRSSDFFAHLHASRIYWQEFKDSSALTMPRVVGRAPKRTHVVRHFPTTEEIVEIIRNTSNVTYKAIFILAAFGGLRVSEIVNLWAVDVLPGNVWPYFFQEVSAVQSAECLVLRADPIHSTYCGRLNDSTQTRLQFLKAEFSLVPRPMLHSRDHQYAGWKGTRYSGGRHTHPVYWIDISAAKLFENCCEEIKSCISALNAHHRHPYLFLNIGDRSQRHLGNPTSIKQAQKAFKRSCKRSGVDRGGVNIHGLRHHYKWFAREQLGLSREVVQIMMGHASVESQDEYGRNARSVYEELSVRRKNFLSNSEL